MKTILFILSILPAILAGDFNAKTLSESEQDSILAIGQSEDNTPRFRLESENEQKIYRHSKTADWYVVDTQRKTRKQLGAGLNLGSVRDAVMSPNGRYVAFAKENNLYIHKLDFGTEVAVTKDTDPDIINGVADWLYEEEFGITALFAWSPDSKMLAFVQLDEHEVPNFSWQTFLYPQYPEEQALRYPKAGCANAKASVCIYDVATKGILRIPLSAERFEDGYIPRLKWTRPVEGKNPVPADLLVLRVNRDQNKMEALRCNAKSTVSHPLYTEESKSYFLDYSLFDSWHWLADNRFIALSEKDGWRRAYLYSAQGMEIKALTPESLDVTAVYGFNEKTQTLFYQAAPTPATRHIYALNSKKGVVTPITEQDGIWSARFDEACTQAVFCFQSFDTPNTYTLWKAEGGKWKEQRVLEDNASIREAWQSRHLPEPQLLKIPNSKGQDLEAMLLSPVTRNPSPLIVMHYSGPASQRVLNRWRKKFEYALVEAGYAVLIVDPRGSDCKGRAWRNETYMSLGQKEAEDLIAAANVIAQRPDIDASRMAILGWSYGGYQTLFTMSTPGHPFKAGIAIAPVTDWKLYDSAYTERYMRRPQVNDRGYKAASLIDKASDLSGSLLLIHGTADDNVHVQHTMQYIGALVRADKHFDLMLYPDDNHHLRRDNNATHMHNTILRFLEKNL